MVNPWMKVWKFLKAMRSSIVVILVVMNMVMAMYTIPALLFGPDGLPESHHPGIFKYQDIADVHKRHISESNNSSARNVRRKDLAYEDYEDFEHNFFYTLQPVTGCDPDEPFLLIAVSSAPQHFDLRKTIRETWASVIHKHRLSTKLVFMLGVPSAEYKHIQAHIVKESRTHKDIIQEDFVDSYVNLTIKSIGILKWATAFCPGVRFVMKTDDDVFVNIPNVITLLMDLATSSVRSKQNKYLIGNLIENAKPIMDRNSKWFAPTTLFRQETYPKYLSGSAYIISGNAVEHLYNAATLRKPFWLEDIFITGMLTLELDFPLIHDDRFTYKRPKLPQPCLYKTVVTAHELSVDDLQRIWKELHVIDMDCSKFVLTKN